MAETLTAALPRGRHHLTREQVVEAQRLRLVVGLADAMAEGGYVATSVASVLKRAGVSRETFYQLYDDKLACFLDALDIVSEVLLAELDTSVTEPGPPLERAERSVSRYLATVVEQPAFARLFLVEVHAAGPEAMLRRAALQDRLTDRLAILLGARTVATRFALRSYVAAISALVATPLATGDVEAVRALRRPLLQQLRALAAAGLVGSP